MLRHPAPWIGLALSAVAARSASSTRPGRAPATRGCSTSRPPLLLGVSMAAASRVRPRAHRRSPTTRRCRPARRSLARLLGGPAAGRRWSRCVVAARRVWLRVSGGLALGDEPGRTAHAHYSLPELLQPVLLAVLRRRARRRRWCTSCGSAGGVHRCCSSSGSWSAATYWMFNGAGRAVADPGADPADLRRGRTAHAPTRRRFPVDWLLSAPGEFQDYWVRLVVSPALAAWHDVYLVALTAARWSRSRCPAGCVGALLVSGALLAVGARR